MRMAGWGAAAAVLLLAGCTAEEPMPSPTPTMAVPAEIQDFLDAAAAEDENAARAHLTIWSEAAGRELTGDELSLECVEAEVSEVGRYARGSWAKVYVKVENSLPYILMFEGADGSAKGYGIEQQGSEWFWQPQAEACRPMWTFSPTPSPSGADA